MADDETVAAQSDDRAVVQSLSVDIVVSVLILMLAVVLGWDSWRTGAGWASDGPQAGYFPFYLSVLMGAASLYGIVSALHTRRAALEPFVTRQQFARVMKVFVPTLAYCVL